jgi:two-component system, NarL family, response regulator NreC
MSSPALSPTDRRTITIVLADDHHLVRAGVRLLLDAEDDLEVVADIADAGAALEGVLEWRPTVLVLDLNMPGELTALDAIPLVREGAPETAVVVLTMLRDPAFARRALKAGAVGYVLKDSADGELVEAVRRAAAGESYLTPQFGASAAYAGSGVGSDELTPREIEVLRLIALGHTNVAIAERLVLSVRTVESHRAHIQRKLGRPKRAQLVRYAIERRLLED